MHARAGVGPLSPAGRSPQSLAPAAGCPCGLCDPPPNLSFTQLISGHLCPDHVSFGKAGVVAKGAGVPKVEGIPGTWDSLW